MDKIKFLMSINSFLLFIFFFIVGKGADIPLINIKYLFNQNFILEHFDFIKYLICFVLLFLYSGLVIFCLSFFGKKDETIMVKEIKPLEFSLIPIYLALFVIVLEFGENSFQNTENIFLFLILFVFWLKLEYASYFNPMWLFFGYRFYEVKTEKNNIIMFITREKDIKITDDYPMKRKDLIRINNFTYFNN